MKILSYFLVVLPLFTCAQTGAISGNAFWHYNDYVGDKPDPGSTVYIKPSDSSKATMTLLCDVMGNFKADGLPVGNYLVVIVSKNSTDDWQHNFIELQSPSFKRYFGLDFTQMDRILYDSIEIYHGYYRQAMMEKYGTFAVNKHIKRVEKQRAIYTGAIKRLVGMTPQSHPAYLDFEFYQTYPHKIFIKEIEVQPNKTSSIVADFGTTYI